MTCAAQRDAFPDYAACAPFQHLNRRVLIEAAVLCLMLFARGARAQTYQVLHSFTGADFHTGGFTGDTDGAHPFAGLIQGPDGNFYGTTLNGQPSAASTNTGTVFRMDAAGHVTILHYLTGVATGDGLGPQAPLILARDGFFYGTTNTSLVSGGATVFRISAQGAFTKLHTFSLAGGDRGFSTSGLLQAADGNFYGVLENGTVSGTQGLVYKTTPNGTTTVVHAFTGLDGTFPSDSLIQASDGHFYGTTGLGGSGALGTVYRISNPTLVLNEFHAFNALALTDGTEPFAGLVQATDGQFYGTTGAGGSNGGGTVFRMDGTGHVTVLHSFVFADGITPRARLLQATDGNFYGTTSAGGANKVGTVFRITPAGAFKVLHAFTGADGAYPRGALIQARDGRLYGTTQNGGAQDKGVVFRLALGLPGVPGHDFDGDGITDIAVYRPSTGQWFIEFSRSQFSSSKTVTFGGGSDVPVMGDFDRDGKRDIAVYRPSTGTWFWIKSSTNTLDFKGWGVQAQGDVPVPGDYDGDGKTDPAVFRPAFGTWFILKSSTNFTTSFARGWGQASDVLMPGDYDFDGTTDIAVYRPSTGEWFLLPSTTGFNTGRRIKFGQPGDVPLHGDFDGDGWPDIAVYRPSTGTWFWLKSSLNYLTYDFKGWGVQAQGDLPVPGDYDGDGKTDPTVFRPAFGTWFVLKSSSNYTTFAAYGWGNASDVPLGDQR